MLATVQRARLAVDARADVRIERFQPQTALLLREMSGEMSGEKQEHTGAAAALPHASLLHLCLWLPPTLRGQAPPSSLKPFR